MPPAAGLNNTGNPSCKIIPKHLYDVNKIFPPGVGLCSIKHGPDNSLPKETKDWLSKVAFKIMYLQLNSKFKCQTNTVKSYLLIFIFTRFSETKSFE